MSYQMDPSGGVVPTGMMNSVNPNDDGCALFLLSPRQIVPHYKRPLMYNFNNQLVESVAENILNHPSHSGSIRKVMNSTNGINTAIVPSANEGISVDTNRYSDHWMFVLIADDKPAHHLHLANKLDVRSIFIGICGDEPISQNGLQSATPEKFLNPNCQLVVTKHLQMTKYNTAGVAGYTTKTGTTSDNNVVHFQPELWHGPGSSIDNSGFYSLTPSHVKDAVVSDEYGDVTTCIRHEDSLNVLGNTKLITALESPRSHMNEILTAFETGAANMMYSATIEDNDAFGDLGDPGTLFRDSVKGSFDQSYILNSPNHISSSFINDPSTTFMTIGMVMNQYYPKVIPVITPTHSGADIIPQHYVTVNNIFSSLVCAVIPMLLSKIGLSSVGFFYNSPNNAFEFKYIDSVISVPQHVLKHKVGELCVLLRNELFPVLFGNCGPFDLSVMCSVSGTTDVALNFFDFELLPNGALYQENSVLGGVVSPLIGTGDQLNQNALQLNNLIAITGRLSNHGGFTY